jgi:hypothetical protein
MSEVKTPHVAAPAVPYRLVEMPGAGSTLLHTAFDQICDPNDWKAPIDAMVPIELLGVYLKAVQFMTGESCTGKEVTREGVRYYRLRSIGYRAGRAGP